ncbi:MAG: phosphatase PAP2 family protein [Verrucomicrobiales bacterium]|nr:phosphatase PAP2 family protein [Verrucomicrobiales bacterium]
MTAWDLELLHLINQQWTSPLLDYVMAAVSAIDAWVPLLVLAGLLLLWKGGARARWMLLCLALALALADGVVAKGMKTAVGRVRPRDAMDGVIIRDLGKADWGPLRLFEPLVVKPSRKSSETRGKSFPSSHVMNLFAAAAVVMLFYRRAGVVVLMLAALVAWSRVYCGAHWPSDIPPSAGLGVAIGWLTVRAVGALRARRQRTR